MADNSGDLRETAKFGSSRALSMQMIPIALGIILFGVVFLAIELSKPYPEGAWYAWLALGAGLALLIAALVRHAGKETHSLVISPFGVLYTDAAKHVIPWNEIILIGRADATHGSGKSRMNARNAVFLCTSNDYYQARVADKTFFTQVFGSEFFVESGDHIRIPLFHPLISAKADDIWAAVEPRWRAFSPHAKDAPQQLVHESYASKAFQGLAHEAGRGLRGLFPQKKNRFGRDE